MRTNASRPRVFLCPCRFDVCFLPCCFSLSAGRGVFFCVFPVNFLRMFMFLYSRGVRSRGGCFACRWYKKSLKKVMEKFGCLVCRLYFCTRFRERNAAARRSPGAGVQ